MDAVQDDTKAVIGDASAMGSVDVTAAKNLRIMYDTLKEKGVKLYITEHIGQLNVQLRKLGLGDMIEAGCVRQTMDCQTAALRVHIHWLVYITVIMTSGERERSTWLRSLCGHLAMMRKMS